MRESKTETSIIKVDVQMVIHYTTRARVCVSGVEITFMLWISFLL